MNLQAFDDSRVESEQLATDERLLWLAQAGARIRRTVLAKRDGAGFVGDRPRGVLVFGAEARLVRAVLEPVCPVPFMAWPGPMLPAWVGPLDLVVVLGSFDAPEWELACAAEAARRGASLLVAAPEESPLAQVCASGNTTQIPTIGDDAMAAAVAVLAVLGELALGPPVHPEHVADAADLVAEACSPHQDLSVNPGKELALAIADDLPLVWGGTVLAGRASRRIAEALRRASRRPALAADADELETLLRSVSPRDPFCDPFETESEPAPVLVLLDVDQVPPQLASVPAELVGLAERAGVRVAHITSGAQELGASDLERYVRLLQQGRYGAAYLGIGLGTTPS